MDLKKIRLLLENYYEGKTGREEEALLTRFFLSDKVPADLEADRLLFLSVKDASDREIPDKEFDKKLFDAIEENDRLKKRSAKMRLIYTISGVAASLLLIVGSYLLFFEGEVREVVATDGHYSEQEMLMAYTEAKNALLLVSSVMNTGTEQLESLSKMTEATRELGAIHKFHQGATGLGVLSKFDETVSALQPDSQ